MAVIHDSEIRLLMQKMPACWKEDFKYRSAANILANNAAYDAQLAYDQRPDTIDADINRFFGETNMHYSNSGNFQSGGFSDRGRGNRGDLARRRGTDQEGEMYRSPVDPAMRGDPEDPEMSMRGQRCNPATVWSYANGAADAELDPDSLISFITAALEVFDEDQRSDFFGKLSDEVFSKFDPGISGTGDQLNAPPPTPTDRTMRNGDRRNQAMDRALVRQYQDTFYDRHPWARSIRVWG